MKLSNCVVGQVIEAKRDVVGLSNERIHKGMQVTVGILDDCATYNLRIQHPSLECGYAWVSSTDFRKVKEAVVPTPSDGIDFSGLREHQERMLTPEPVVQEKLPPTYIQVGDYILPSGRDPELEADILYEVVKVDPRHIGIALHTSSREAWQEDYCLTMSDYSKVLREVQPDADTPTA